MGLIHLFLASGSEIKIKYKRGLSELVYSWFLEELLDEKEKFTLISADEIWDLTVGSGTYVGFEAMAKTFNQDIQILVLAKGKARKVTEVGLNRNQIERYLVKYVD